MSKATDIVVKKILNSLNAGVVPWHCPWATARSRRTDTEYRGINRWVLRTAEYKSPYWATYKYVKELGGNVKKGEKGCPLLFWKFLEKDTGRNDSNGDPIMSVVPIVRYYTVFNLDQTENVDEELHSVGDVKEILLAEDVIAGKFCTASEGLPDVVDGTRAAYSPGKDKIAVPNMAKFDTSEEYYLTVFHELIHSTGHAARLNRKEAFDVEASARDEVVVAREELTAEMGAAILAYECGIDVSQVIDSSASYIAHWKKFVAEEPRAVVQAASRAEKAVDFILGRTFKK